MSLHARWDILNGVRVLFYFGSSQSVNETLMTDNIRTWCPKAQIKTVPELLKFFNIHGPEWPSLPGPSPILQSWDGWSSIQGCVESADPSETAYILSKYYPGNKVTNQFSMYLDDQVTLWSFVVALINDKHILFYSPVSSLVNFKDVENWINGHVKVETPHTNAMNVHNVC